MTLQDYRTMSRPLNLDMDALRTFVTGFELGNFARAAERLGRSQSAVSTQLRKLEMQAGQPLVQKAGRTLALTIAGEGLLSYAKRLLDLNDEAVDSLRGAAVEGWARLGLPQDFAERWLPTVLSRFSRSHPKVRVEVQVDRSVPLTEKTLKGELDLALVWDDGRIARHAERIAELPIHWIGRPPRRGAVSLVTAKPPHPGSAVALAVLRNQRFQCAVPFGFEHPSSAYRDRSGPPRAAAEAWMPARGRRGCRPRAERSAGVQCRPG
jgi:hypothetical protein